MDKRIYLCLAHMSGKEMGFIQEAFDTNCLYGYFCSRRIVGWRRTDLEHDYGTIQ